MMKKATRVQGIKLAVISVFALCALVFGLSGYFDSGAKARQNRGGGLSAPTGVSASDNDYFDKVGLHWDTIRGATLYRIYRNTTNSSSGGTDVGTTAKNFFFDETAVQGTQYYYFVRAENGATTSDFSSSDAGQRLTGSYNPNSIYPIVEPTAPAGNQITAAKAYLGKALFWDEQMSSTRTVSCGTCHRAGEGGSDPRTADNPNSVNPGLDTIFGTPDDIGGSMGVPMNNSDGTYSMNASFGFRPQVTGRKAPSYLNAGYNRSGLFWDGRANDVFRDPITNAIVLNEWGGLESQVLGPPVNSGEMGHGGRNWTQVAARISSVKPLAVAHNIPAGLAAWIEGRTYPQLFEEAFGTPEVTPSRIAMAIATHERTLFSDRAPIDKANGGQNAVLTAQEQTGASLFTSLRCNACHGGPLFTDNNFHNIGASTQADDPGRFAVTGLEEDRGRFRTPHLRNVELHGPYMHNGRYKTLEEVMDFYDRGGDHTGANIDPKLIHPLFLADDEKAALVAFMKRPMTDPRVANELPPFDRPKLYTESIYVPQIQGSGRNGSGSIEPEATAIEPPFVGNPGFTVAVSKALGNASAVLVINSTDPGVGASIPATGSFFRQQITLSGTGNGNGYGSISLPIPKNPALAGQTFFGRWYVTDAGAANGFSVSKLISFTVFGTSAVQQGVHADFDGDRKTDVSVFRPSNGQWHYIKSSNSQTDGTTFGLSTDKVVPADYTGDGKTDVAVWRPSDGTWYVLSSNDSTVTGFHFGTSTDIPAPGDFDGDGKADYAVFRPADGTWYVQASVTGFTAFHFGQAGDVPQVGDYDSDGKADFAVFRQVGILGEWWVNRSSGGYTGVQFGLNTDKPVAGDYTGDGKADIAVWRPSNGTWYVLRSEDNNLTGLHFGANGDQPAPGDYDGDGRYDFAIFRAMEGNFYMNRTSQGFGAVAFGTTGDRAVPGAYTP